MHKTIVKELKSLSHPEKAKTYARFFKTGKGEYGEGDIFRGLTMPEIRTIAKTHTDTTTEHLTPLLESPIREQRMCAAVILTYKYAKSKSDNEKKDILNFYIKNISAMNNRDIIDVTTPKVIGQYLLDFSQDKKIVALLDSYNLSNKLWLKRISILATYPLIKKGDFSQTLKYAKQLLNDNHDLIHKAVGRMLREVGKMDQNTEEQFLKQHYQSMPRTMLRYAIEKFPEEHRQRYLKGQI